MEEKILQNSFSERGIDKLVHAVEAITETISAIAAVLNPIIEDIIEAIDNALYKLPRKQKHAIIKVLGMPKNTPVYRRPKVYRCRSNC